MKYGWKLRTVSNLKYSYWGSADSFFAVYCLILFKHSHLSRAEIFFSFNHCHFHLLSYPLVLVLS